METEALFDEMNLRIRMFRAMQKVGKCENDISDRELLLLEHLSKKKKMSVSEIANTCPMVSGSTISTTITKLWKDKELVAKIKDPDNQRVTTVVLTPKGLSALDEIRKKRAEVYKTVLDLIAMDKEEEEVFKNIMKRVIRYFDSMQEMEEAAS